MMKVFLRRQVQRSRDLLIKPPHRENCGLALGSVTTQDCIDQYAMQVDDEELELRELQARPNSLSSCEHLAADTSIGCVLCKGQFKIVLL